MNRYIILGIIVIAAIVIWVLVKNLGSTGEKIDPSEAKKRLDSDKKIILLDVRTHDEYIEKHIPKSILIPVNELKSKANSKLPDKDAEIFIYCRSGNRSTTAANILAKLGYTKVYNLGGIINWPYETVTGNK